MRRVIKNPTVQVVIVFVGVLIGSALLVYALLRGTTNQPAQTRAVPAASPSAAERPGADEDQSILGRLFESKSAETGYAAEGFGTTLARITLRLILAACLGAALAFRPRRKLRTVRRNPYVAQTQILLAIVASALMMIVGDNAARAFGIFAAVSLVRFRTNIRDPKEISVLLISLALGLATGVGRPDLAVILCVFALVVLWTLEHFESQQVFRSMDLKVGTKDIEATQAALKTVFTKKGFPSEFRGVTRNGEEPAGTIINSVEVSPETTTDELSSEVFAEDGGNITSIEWEPKKNFSYLYQ